MSEGSGIVSKAATRKLSHLSFAGWLLTLAVVASIGLAARPIGLWALGWIDRSLIRQQWPIYLLAVPALLAGLITWVIGARLLRRAGVSVWRSRPQEPND